MNFKQLTLLAEDDFMAGMEAYEDMSMHIYTWDKDFGIYHSTIKDFIDSSVDADNSLDRIFGMDVNELIKRLKANECIKGHLTAFGDNTPIWVCNNVNRIKDIRKQETLKNNLRAAPISPEDDV